LETDHGLDQLLGNPRQSEGGAPVAITRARGQEGVVMVSASEWASIEETLYLLRSPANAARLLEAIAGLEAGGGEEHELIEP
jgi:antitoxin YefM